MNVQKIFREQRAVIVEGWINAGLFDLSPSNDWLLRTKNDLTNPVGDATMKPPASLVTIAGEHVTPQKIKHALDRFVRLRAVQQYTPSQGLGVFFLMKPLLREHILPLCREKEDLAEYLDAESRLDSVTLLAFDLYSAARETPGGNAHRRNTQSACPAGALGAIGGWQPGFGQKLTLFEAR